MDEFQKKLIEMKKQVPDCTASRQRLRSVMSDFFPGEKRRINAILNAYDEDIEVRLSNSSDKTLTALQLVKVLKDDYGLADDNAVEAAAAWCFIMGLDEIAEALSFIQITSDKTNIETAPSNRQNGFRKKFSEGVYLSGYDFPAGDVQLEVDSLVDRDGVSGVYYEIIKKGANTYTTNGSVKPNGHVILSLKEGMKLMVSWQGTILLTSVTGVS